MSNLVLEKVNQAVNILEEKEIDLWLTFARETTAGGDPVLSLIYGLDVTWQSAFLITRKGDSVAIVGHYEAEAAKQVGAYSEVISYHQSIRNALLETIGKINPVTIGLNFSKDDVHADGLGYGLYQVLLDYLSGSPYKDRLISAQEVAGALRSRKTEGEINRIRKAVETSELIFAKTFEFASVGMSEIQVSDFMHAQVKSLGLQEAWDTHHCPSVNSGPNSPVGHLGPGETTIQPGHILHIDFGVKQDQYCADLQRVLYFLNPNETEPPPQVREGFQVVTQAVAVAVNSLRPGIAGKEVDALARNIVTTAGYPEYMYATGHHLGRTVHDGAGILGPEWERYGNTPNFLVESGHVYTIEPGIFIPDHGYIGLEEDVVVTENGSEFLSTPHTRLDFK